VFVTSEGTASGRFRRALNAGNAREALEAAGEMQVVPLFDALELLRLMAQVGDRRYPRLAGRWVERYAAERRASLGDLQLIAGALVRMGEEPADPVVLETLESLVR
jgi:hypothetical protein